VYENPSVLPRFFLVNRTAKARSEKEAIALLRARGFDPKQVAIVESDVRVPENMPPAAQKPVQVVEYGPARVVLAVDSAEAAFLVTSEAYYPGWRAFVDGAEGPLILTNVAFRGLAVPPGRHTVEMRFEPAILRYGAWLSLAGAGLLIVAVVFGDNMRKRAPWISLSN